MQKRRTSPPIPNATVWSLSLSELTLMSCLRQAQVVLELPLPLEQQAKLQWGREYLPLSNKEKGGKIFTNLGT